MCKISFLIIVLVCTLVNVSKAQDPVYSSYSNNSLYYNPAATSLVDGTEFKFNFREQWPGIPSENHAMNFSLARNFCDIISLGLLASNNIEGESRLTTNNIALLVAVPIKVYARHRRYVQFISGFSTAFGQKRIDFSKIEFDDQYDKLYGKMYPTNFVFPDDYKKTYLDMSIGFILRAETQVKKRYFNSAILGGSLQHAIVAPDANFIGSEVKAVPYKIVIHGYYLNMYKKNGNGFSPSFLFEKQSSMQTFNLSLNIKYELFITTFGYRNTSFISSINKFDSFILGLSMLIPDRRSNPNPIKFSYIYDFTVSKLSTGAYGSHEISISYLIRNKCSGNLRRYASGIDFQCMEDNFIGESGFFLKPRK